MSNGNATETAKPLSAGRHPNRDICPSLQGFGRPVAGLAAGRRRDVHFAPANSAIDRRPLDPWPPSRKRVATGEGIQEITERRRLRQTGLEGPAKAASGARMCELHVHLAPDVARVPRAAWQWRVAHEPGAFAGQKRAIEFSRDGGIER